MLIIKRLILTKEGNKYRIKRYSESGKIECSRIFYTNKKGFKIKEPFKFSYISHCKECVTTIAKEWHEVADLALCTLELYRDSEHTEDADHHVEEL